MSKEYRVRILAETEYAVWDQLVVASPGGTVYNTSWWVDTIARLNGARMEIVGCFVGDNLCGGCAAYVRPWAGRLRVVAPPTTPYNGFVLREPATPDYRRRLLALMDVSGAIAGFMERRYDEVRLRHHYALSDLRGMIWRGWDTDVTYTYVVDVAEDADILARCSSSVRRTVKKARNAGLVVEECDDIVSFVRLYTLTYGKHDLGTPVSSGALTTLYEEARKRSAARLLLARDAEGQVLSGMIQLVLGSRADTWVMATDPDRLRSGAGVYTQVHSFANPCTNVTCIDEASANLPGLHESEVKLGVELVPVYRSHFNRSMLITLWRCLRGRFASESTSQ